MTRLYIPANDESAARKVASAIARNLFGVPAHYQSEQACRAWLERHPKGHRLRVFPVNMGEVLAVAILFGAIWLVGLLSMWEGMA